MIEYIIIDGLSTDQTTDIIQSNIDKVDCFISEKDSGIYDAMNKGIKLSTGEYILFLNSDDWLSTDNIISVANDAKTNEIDLVVGNALVFDNEKIVHNWKPKYFDSRIMLGGTPLCHQACIAKRSILLSGFNHKIRLSADYNWLKEVYLNGHNVSLLNKDLVCFEWGGAAASNRNIWISECLDMACKQFSGSNEHDMKCFLDYVYSGDIYNKKKPHLELPIVNIISLINQNAQDSLFLNSLIACLLDRLCFSRPDKFYHSSIPLNPYQEKNLSLLQYYPSGRIIQFFIDFNNSDQKISWLQVRAYQANISSRASCLRKLCYLILDSFQDSSLKIKKFTHTLKESSSMAAGDINPPLISVVIPIYNIRNYIRQCVLSVLNQRYAEIEILCIDDGSPEDCETVLSDILTSDQRVRYLGKPNGGLSSARNFGLTHAHGKYIHFLDGDDYLEPGIYETLIPIAELYNAQVVKSNLSYHLDALPEVDPLSDKQAVTIIDLHKKPSYFGFISPCASIFRKDHLVHEKITFVEGITYEDRPFNLKALATASRIVHVSYPFYRYRWKRPGSIMSNRGLTIKHFRDSLKAMNISNNQIYPNDFDHSNVVLDSMRYFTMCLDINVIPKTMKSLYYRNFSDLFGNIISDIKPELIRTLPPKMQCILHFFQNKNPQSPASIIGYLYLASPSGSKELPYKSILKTKDKSTVRSSCIAFENYRSIVANRLGLHSLKERPILKAFIEIALFPLVHLMEAKDAPDNDFSLIVQFLKIANSHILALEKNVLNLALETRSNIGHTNESALLYIHSSGINYTNLKNFVVSSFASDYSSKNIKCLCQSSFFAKEDCMDDPDLLRLTKMVSLFEFNNAIANSILGLSKSIFYILKNPVHFIDQFWFVNFPYSPFECLLGNLNEYLSHLGGNQRPRLILIPHGLPQKLIINSFSYDLVMKFTNDPSWNLNFSKTNAKFFPLGFPELLNSTDEAKEKKHFSLVFLSQISGAYLHKLPSLRAIGIEVIKAIISLAIEHQDLSFYIRFRDVNKLKNLVSDSDYRIIMESATFPNICHDDMIASKYALGAIQSDSIVSCSSSGLLYARKMSATAVQITDNSILSTWPYFLASKDFLINRSYDASDLSRVLYDSIKSSSMQAYPVANFSLPMQSPFMKALSIIS